MHVAHYDHRMSRLFLDSAGFWDVAEAMTLYTEVTMACRDARRAGAPLSILSDLSDYFPQGGEVSDIHAKTAAEIANTPIARYVTVVDKALNRMRLKRLLAGVRFDIVASRGEAMALLGWSDTYMRRLPMLDRSNLVSIAPQGGAKLAYGRAA